MNTTARTSLIVVRGLFGLVAGFVAAVLTGKLTQGMGASLRQPAAPASP